MPRDPARRASRWRRTARPDPMCALRDVDVTAAGITMVWEADSAAEAVLTIGGQPFPLQTEPHGEDAVRVTVRADDLPPDDVGKGRFAVADGRTRMRVAPAEGVELPRQLPVATGSGDVAAVRLTAPDAGLTLTWRRIPLHPASADPSGTHRSDADPADADPDQTVRWGGLESAEAHRRPLAVMHANLAAACTALAADRIDHLVVSGPWEPGRVLVGDDDADRSAAALDRVAQQPSWHVLRDGATTRLFRSVVSPGRTVHHQRSLATRVEPRPRTTWPLPDGTSTRGHAEVPTHESYRRPTVTSAPPRIDAVWTWVDSGDPAWQQARAAAMGRSGTAQNSESASRFDDHDELRYSLRSALDHAPWIDRFVLLTAGHLPAWLDPEHPRLRVVRHDEVFDADALPTFNSHAIEAQLHRIEGLSEHFLYVNDDVFFGRPTTPELFFGPAGACKVFASPTPIPHVPVGPEDSGFYAARKNNRALIEREFGVTTHHAYLHTPHALRRDVLAELATRFPEEWLRTSRAAFRSSSDIATASALHHDVALLTGRAQQGRIASKYVRAGCAADQPAMRDLYLRRDRDVFCLNDTADRDLPADQQRRGLLAFLRASFPQPAPWEIPGR